MKKIYFSFILFLIAVFAAANQVDSLAMQDTISVVDTLVVTHPAPVHLTQRAAIPLAEPCPVDSVVCVDNDNNRVSLTEYEYDEVGHITLETSYRWISGIRTGVLRTRKIYNGSNAVVTINYNWNTESQNWVGRDSTVLLYEGTTNIGSALYVLENNEWRYETLYEYAFNKAGKRILSRYSKWDAGEQALVYVNKYEWEFDAAGNQTVASYWLFNNGEWEGKTNTITAYDDAKNKILEEKYSGWENNDWKGTTKNTFVYNANKKLIEQVTYKWSGGWVEQTKQVKDYDGANIIESATYMWQKDEWIGTTRSTKVFEGKSVQSETTWQWDNDNKTWKQYALTEYIYNGSKVLTTTISAWAGEAWMPFTLLENTYDASGKLEKEALSVWRNETWNDSLRTYYTYDDKGTNNLKTIDKWIDAEWKASDSVRHEIAYQTINDKEYKVLDLQEEWTSTTGTWIGKSRSEWEYDEAGNTTVTLSYTFMSGVWVYNTRLRSNYKNNNGKLVTLEEQMTWNNSKQMWVGKSKFERDFDDSGKLILSSTYKWNNSRNDWEGVGRSSDIYENNVKITSYVDQWNADEWDWMGMFKYNYSYDAAGHTIEQIMYRYNAEGQAFTNYTKTTQEYNNNTLIRTSSYSWMESINDWCISSTDESAYDEDSNAKLRSKLTASWNNCELSAYENQQYYYHCDTKLFTVTFNNWNDTALLVVQVPENAIPEYTAIAPERDANAQYSYSFQGWDKEIVPATEDIVYTAQYAQTLNQYTIRFLNYDGTELQSMQVDYGQTPEYAGATPVRESTTEEVFTFSEWSPQIVPVTGDADYTAQFTAQQISQLWFTVNFVNYDDSPLKTISVRYGQYPIYGEDAPIRPSEGNNVYEFVGWEPALQIVTADITFKAVYTASVLPTAMDETDAETDNAPCYNLLGTQVGNDYKGVVIQNGKIFIR